MLPDLAIFRNLVCVTETLIPLGILCLSDDHYIIEVTMSKSFCTDERHRGLTLILNVMWFRTVIILSDTFLEESSKQSMSHMADY